MGVRSGKGDRGYTELSFHRRVRKDSAEIQAMGDLDELSSHLGLLKSKTRSKSEKAVLEAIQRALSAIVTEITVGDEKMGPLLRMEDAEWISGMVYQLEKEVDLKSCFHFPGGGELSSLYDIARSVARRAERSVVALFKKEKMKNDDILAYLNCVSDVLFILARKETRRKKGKRKSRLK